MKTRFWNTLGVLALVLGMALPMAPVAQAGGGEPTPTMNIWVSRSALYTDMNGNEQSLFSVVASEYTGIYIRDIVLYVDGIERQWCNRTGIFATCEAYLVIEPGLHRYHAVMTNNRGHAKYSDEAYFFVRKPIKPATISGNVRDLALGLPVEADYRVIGSDGDLYATGRTQDGMFNEGNLPPGQYSLIISTTEYVRFLVNPLDSRSGGGSWSNGNTPPSFIMGVAGMWLGEGSHGEVNVWLFGSVHDPNVTPPQPGRG